MGLNGKTNKTLLKEEMDVARMWFFREKLRACQVQKDLDTESTSVVSCAPQTLASLTVKRTEMEDQKIWTGNV